MIANDTQSIGQHEVFPINMGEAADFERVFALYAAPLRLYCEDLIANDEECEELINELFTELWLKQIRFNDTEHAQAYLYRSTKNICFNFIRNKERFTKKLEALITEQTEASDDPYDTFARTEVWAELYRAIESLPSQCCKVITMSYLDGMSNQEIADELDLSIKTVKNHKLRALDILRIKLPSGLFTLLLGTLFVS